METIVQKLSESNLLSAEAIGSGAAIWLLLSLVARVFPRWTANHWVARFLPLAPFALGWIMIALGWPPCGATLSERFVMVMWLGFWAGAAHKILSQTILGQDARIQEAAARKAAVPESNAPTE